MKPGDRCRITVQGVERPIALDAVVHLVNVDGLPSAFAVDAFVEEFAGWLPVIWREGKAYTFRGSRVSIVEVEP